MRLPVALHRSTLLLIGSVLLLLGVAAPACAESYSYEGQLQLQASTAKACTALAEASYPIHVYGRDDGPQGIEGYLYGEKVVPAHFIGNALNQLALTFPGGGGQTSTMRLRSGGDGSFSGELPALSMVAALANCGAVSARIRFVKVATHIPADYERAAALYQLDDRSMQLYVAGMKGRVSEAVSALQDGLAQKQKLYAPNHPQLLPYLAFLAQLQEAGGDYAAAVDAYRAAAALCEQSFGADSACSGLMLIGLGAALIEAGRYTEAGDIQQRTLAICSRLFGGDAPVCGRPLNALGAVQIYTGHYAEAEATLNQALALNRRDTPGDNGNVGVSLNNLAVVYRYTGRYAKAEAMQRQALAVDTRALGSDAPLTILNTVVLAQILRLSNQQAAAEPLARSALAAAERVLGPQRGDHPALSGALLALAEILRETGRYAEAEPLYRQALANSSRHLGAQHPDVAMLSMQLAKLLHATGRDAEALALLRQAYVVANHSDNPGLAWRVRGTLMQVYAAGPLANRTLAIYYGKEAVNDLQRIRGNLAASSGATQQAFVSSAEVSAIYHQLVALLVADGRASEAQAVIAMVKEQEFYAFTERSSETAAPRTVAALNTAERQLDELASRDVARGREYAALQEQFRNGQLDAGGHARLNQLRTQMDQAQAAFDARAAAVARGASDPETQRRRQHEIDDFSRAFQGTLKDLGHDAVMLQYFIQDDRVTIFLTTANSFLAREAPIARADLNARIRAFRRTLSTPSQDPLPEATALYQLLIGPVAADLRQAGARTLMLSLDDTLRYLPFAALYDGTHYLVETVSIALVTEAVRDKLSRPPSADWKVWGLGLTKGGKDYDALPYAGIELDGIAGRQGILSGKVLLDGAFTENALRDGLDLSYPIIHIASHFQFTPGSMDDSFLLLGDGSHMTLAQIRTRLNFSSVELLTLSACETALGDDVGSSHGAEVEGLGALAQDAGARSVLATLWPVADASTAALMRALYEAHRDGHVDKAEALRQAQLALLHGTARAEGLPLAARGLARGGPAANAAPATFKADPAAPFAHPYFWAPFILMGNWL